MINATSKSLSALFQEYGDSSLLERLEQYALWTIPSVFPSQCNIKQNGNAIIEHDYQSIGALLVNRLTTKLARTLFPVETSFFKIDVTEETKALVKRTMNQDLDSSAESLIQLENQACKNLFLNASYAQLIQALRLLVITGNCLIVRKDKRIRVYSVRSYVLKRNHIGEVQQIIIEEAKRYSELTPELKTMVGEHDPNAILKLYTSVEASLSNIGKRIWTVTQEIAGKPVSGKTVYRDQLCPYIPVDWSYVNGDAYGRGYVEEYAGDLAKLSELSEQLTIYELQCAKILNIFNPSGQFDIASAEDAESGDWISGDPNSVAGYEVGNYQKIMQLREDLQDLERRLSVAFMYTGNTRDAERVTTYEIQVNAQEAEQVLGGVYSQLSQAMHLPLAYLLVYEINPSIINAFDVNNVELNILTGLIALSRNADNQALLVAVNQIAAIIPVLTQASKKFNIDKVMTSILLSNGIDPSTLYKTREELEAEAMQEEQAAQAQQQQVMQQGNQLQGTEAVLTAQGQI